MNSYDGDVVHNMEHGDMEICSIPASECTSSFELAARFSDSLSRLQRPNNQTVNNSNVNNSDVNNSNVDISNVNNSNVDISNADVLNFTETEIRQSYNTLIKTNKQIFTKDMMIKLWDSWIKTITPFNGSYNIKLARIRAFILDPEQTELKIYNHTSKSRQEYHEISSLLRLEHISVLDDVKKQDNIKINIEESNHDKQFNNKDNRWDVFRKNKISNYNANATDSTFKKSREKDIGKPQVYENFNIKHKHEKAEKAEIVKTLIIRKPENWRWEFTL